MQLNNCDIHRALIVSKEPMTITLRDGADRIEAETKLSSVSEKPYLQSFAALRGFLEHNDLVDAVIVDGLVPSDYEVLKHILDDFKVRRLIYTVNAKALNYGFFDKRFKATLTIDQYLPILAEAIGEKYEIQFTQDNNKLYVYIEKIKY